MVQIDVEQSEPGRFAEFGCEPFRHTQILKLASELAEAKEWGPKVEADVDRQLQRLPGGRHMADRGERLLEETNRIAIGRARGRLRAGLTRVERSLAPMFRLSGMKGQPLGMLDEAIGVQGFARCEDAAMHRATRLMKHAPVGDLVRQSMAKRVFEVREGARLVEELRRLELHQDFAK